MDSLNAIQLRSTLNSLVRQLRKDIKPLPATVIYHHPTVDKLASFLESYISGQPEDTVNERTKHIESLIEKYSADLHPNPVSLKASSGSGLVFIVTGATGSLGCHVVASLLRRTDLFKIYCFCRSASTDPLFRLRQAFASYALDLNLLESNLHKLEIMEVDLSQSEFGLDGATLNRVSTSLFSTKCLIHNLFLRRHQIRGEATNIVHTAWHMNFNTALEDFEPVHIRGLHNLLRLFLSLPSSPSTSSGAETQSQTPHFVFISSIAAAGSLSLSPSHPIPEAPISDPSVVLDELGYGQAKFVCERIIDRLASSASGEGRRFSVVRCGQLSGSSVNGRWNASEHVPILMRSSVHEWMKMVPVDWQVRVCLLPSSNKVFIDDDDDMCVE